ncbi:TlpA family protein disulfide reductase [Roseateles sp. BYS180W]|uniref:TlpA family protein disulfide reductase n=2 Tax=Roseateles rivi TaxID=3299028 RepID=A0ABW7FSK8_9BURK
MTEAELRQAMGLQGYQLRYEDAQGRPVSFDALMALLKTTGGLSIEKDADKKTAVIKQSSVDAKGKAGQIKPEVKVGQVLPAATGQTLEGQARTVPLEGAKPTLLSLYFARCPPCVAEVPELNALAQKYPDVNFLGVTFDDASTAKNFIDEHGLKIPVLVSAQPYLKQIGVSRFPSLILVDTAGRVSAAKTGGTLPGDAGGTGISDWFAQALKGLAPTARQ